MNNEIRHSNIIYMPNISELGGIETYVYEMVKKYKPPLYKTKKEYEI